MEDKTFELLTRMYSEFLGRFENVDSRLDKMDGRFDKVDSRLDKMDGRLDKMDGRLDKMDGRFDKMDGRFDKMDSRLDKMDGRLENVENQVRKIQIKLEHDIEPKIEALYEDRDIVHARLNSIEHKVDELTTRIDQQDMQIRVIKGGKGARNS